MLLLRSGVQALNSSGPLPPGLLRAFRGPHPHELAGAQLHARHGRFERGLLHDHELPVPQAVQRDLGHAGIAAAGALLEVERAGPAARKIDGNGMCGQGWAGARGRPAAARAGMSHGLVFLWSQCRRGMHGVNPMNGLYGAEPVRPVQPAELGRAPRPHRGQACAHGNVGTRSRA